MQKSKLGIVGIGVLSFFFSSFLFAMGPDNNCKGLFTSNAYQALPSMVREDGDNYYWTTKDGRYLLFLTPRNLALLQPGTVIEDSIMHFIFKLYRQTRQSRHYRPSYLNAFFHSPTMSLIRRTKEDGASIFPVYSHTP